MDTVELNREMADREDSDSWETVSQSSSSSSEDAPYSKLKATCAYTDYADFDKGKIGDITEMTVPCSSAFLQMILYDLKRVLRVCASRQEKQDTTTLDKVLNTIYYEFVRLEGHPDLFPDDNTREEFFRGIKCCCQQMDALNKHLEEIDQHEHELHKSRTHRMAQKDRPGFDEHQKPWNQFFQKGAPGSGVDTSSMPQLPPRGGYLQIVPFAGCQLLSNWLQENNAACRELGMPMFVPKAFQQLLAAYSPAQIAEMAQSAAYVGGDFSGGEHTKSSKGVTKKIMTVAVKAKATRPLNSWMAFRSYYAPIFTTLQQKDKSGFLTYLWSADPFKAKWTILAKAYSVIRDKVGKQDAPLDAFLEINGPFVGIVAPADYLVMLGWEITMDGEGQISLRRCEEIDLASIDYDLLTTNLSVQDIVQHSYEFGYFMDIGAGLDFDVFQPAMMMATGVQGPTIINPVQKSGDLLDNNILEQGRTQDDDVQVHDVEQQVGSKDVDAPPFPVDSSFESVEMTNNNFDDTVTGPSTEVNELSTVNSTDLDTWANQSTDPMLTTWTTSQNESSGEEPILNLADQVPNPVLALGNEYYSLNEGEEFNTELDFNPYMGSSFNPFDLSGFAYEDGFNNLDPFSFEF
ncbi:MAG: hypothetical protein Q9187_000199 [Circinaria calcarea]